MAGKEYRGIEVNLCMFQGKIIEDPIVSGPYVWMKLRTVVVNKVGDSFQEQDQIVQLVVEPGGPTNVASKYVKTGRKLLAWTTYKTVVDANGNQFPVFVVNRIDLGDKPYEAPQQ